MAGPVKAETFPTRTVTIVVPFSAGGSTDTVARLVATNLQGQFGQPFVVENKPGASGNIAASYVARSAPDGYTLFMGTSTSIANMSLFKNLNYDMLTDFVPVSQTVYTPLVMIVNPNSPAKTFQDFLKMAKEAKQPLTYGSGGSGTSQHLAGALFENLADVKMVHVPYKGAAPAVTDLMGGQIDVMFSPLVDAIGYIRGGKLRALALTTPKESAQLPGVPTLASALAGFDVPTWNGIFAPAKTPPAIVDALSKAIQKAMREPDMIKTVEGQGSDPVGSTPAEFKSFVEKEQKVWQRLVEISGAKVE
ncbi:tripartite tricarboxylate transporter substrate binding protein [Xanthobacter tagetidis]|jgi:tripartite-type tricarboxylate transporter receptor subunit TctC|uniref:Tripartite tricarboxylate transporter substrate binding protein n=2 Tax=Xanthobacter tagetidis TaxID=60216 RepID=A0A3L6ZVI9_9HYPH|nr:tripartite tricarboxylate transporter substrate binding protein [Xanthobacter tagetidis]